MKCIKANHYEREKRGKQPYAYINKYRKNFKRIKEKGTAAENLFDEEAEYVGWEVLRNGWPDRLIYNKKTNKIFLVEIKSQGDWLKSNQKKMHEILRLAGVTVLTLKIDLRKTDVALKLRDKLYKMLE